MTQRGKYIVIEGGDGTGKTTQADLLHQYLQTEGIAAIHVKEPGGSPVAEAIREVILNGTLERTPMTNILLFTANRHELWHSVINPALEKGTWVICTRNYWSTLAYQGYGEGMDMGVITAITSTFTSKQYMHPDASIMLLFNDQAERKRRIAERGKLANPDTFESKQADFQEKVDEGYAAIAVQYSIPAVDAGQSIDAIQAQIRGVISLEHLHA